MSAIITGGCGAVETATCGTGNSAVAEYGMPETMAWEL